MPQKFDEDDFYDGYDDYGDDAVQAKPKPAKQVLLL
jgi:hypothetical protein